MIPLTAHCLYLLMVTFTWPRNRPIRRSSARSPQHRALKDQERGAEVQPEIEQQPLQIMEEELEALTLDRNIKHRLLQVTEITGSLGISELISLSIARDCRV